MEDTILVTGGAGFIGSNFVLQSLRTEPAAIVNVDKLTYAGNLKNLESVLGEPKHRFENADIADTQRIRGLLSSHQVRAVVHFAAESHVDRSISGPAEFIQTNIQGTFFLLESVREYWSNLSSGDRDKFRFLHVSTDEVYGSLGPTDPAFSETTPYAPNSPYAASKASSDHLVRAYHHTYGLPTLTTNCSNNYGPFQFPEKLIPLVIHNARQGKPLPVYGDGRNVRDWLFVEDHCDAIRTVLAKGVAGETYNMGGRSEMANIDVVHLICDLLDNLRPRLDGVSHRSLVTFVKDRPGHDQRYAIDAGKIERELGWKPRETFQSGLRRTVQWYLDHDDWTAEIATGEYRNWIATQYAAR